MGGSFRGPCVCNTADMPKIGKIRATFGGRFAAIGARFASPSQTPPLSYGIRGKGFGIERNKRRPSILDKVRR